MLGAVIAAETVSVASACATAGLAEWSVKKAQLA
jgi:hypothetical protein